MHGDDVQQISGHGGRVLRRAAALRTTTLFRALILFTHASCGLTGARWRVREVRGVDFRSGIFYRLFVPHSMYPPVGTPGRNGGFGWGRCPPHPPNPGSPEGTSKIVIFVGFWAFGEFSYFSLSSRILPFYTMRYTRVMSMSRRVYMAAEAAAVIEPQS